MKKQLLLRRFPAVLLALLTVLMLDPIKGMDGTTRYIDLHFKFTFTFTFCFDGFMKKRQFNKK